MKETNSPLWNSLMRWKYLFIYGISVILMAVQDVSAQAGCGSCADGKRGSNDVRCCFYYSCCVNKEKTDWLRFVSCWSSSPLTCVFIDRGYMSQSCELTTTVCMREHIQGHRETEAMCWNNKEARSSCLNRGLFHLTVRPCVNDKVNYEPWQEPKGRSDKTASGHIHTWTYRTLCCMNINSVEHTSSIKGTT